MADEPGIAAARRRFGDLLHVSGYAAAGDRDRTLIDAHLADAARIPVDLAARVVRAGLRGVYIGSGRVADLDELGFLRDEDAYHRVPGVYDRQRKYIVMGTRGRRDVDAHDLLHEFGHAIGDLLGLNDREVPRALHGNVDVWVTLSRHLRDTMPGSDRGIRELVAESVRDRILDREIAVRFYGIMYVDWLDRELGFR